MAYNKNGANKMTYQTVKERIEAEKIARDAEALAAYNDFLTTQNDARLAALLADFSALGVGGIGGSVTQTDIDETVNTAIANLVSTAAAPSAQVTKTYKSLLHGIAWSTGLLSATTISSTPGYKYTDFIPVVAGDTYCTNIVFQTRTVYYNSEKSVVGSAVALTSGMPFTVPSGTGIAYIRLCTTDAVYNDKPYIVHAATLGAAGGYVPPTDYSATLSDTVLKDEIIRFVTESLPDKVTTITETTLNYINSATNSVGYLNSTGALVANASYFCTDFIPVKTGKTYTTNCVPVYSATYTGYYNKYNNLISTSVLAATAGSVGASSPVTFTITDPNVAFIRISSAVGVPNKMMTDGSTMPSTFQSYNAKKLAFPATITRDLNVYGLDGLKWACYGDSITSIVAAAAIGATNYHQQIAAKTGIIPIDYGIGGSRIARPTGITITDCMTDRIPSGDVTADIITLMGGVNDATSSLGVTPLGVMADRTTTTFYGALHVACLALLTRFPSKGIGLITQTPRHSYMAAQLPYVNAMVEVAQYYSIPCLDLNRSSGLYPDSVYYYTNYFGDTNPDAFGLHPNTIGHSIIARQILQFVMKLKPL
jgi:lysophospholipase L1-like esterase